MESFAAESWWGNVSACVESQNPPPHTSPTRQPSSAGVSLSQQAFPLGWLNISSHPAEMCLRSPEPDQGAVLIPGSSFSLGGIHLHIILIYGVLFLPVPNLGGLVAVDFWIVCFLLQQVWLSSVPVARLGATLHILLSQGIMPVRSTSRSLLLCPGRHNFLRGPQKKSCSFSLLHSQSLRSVQKTVI